MTCGRARLGRGELEATGLRAHPTNSLTHTPSPPQTDHHRHSGRTKRHPQIPLPKRESTHSRPTTNDHRPTKERQGRPTQRELPTIEGLSHVPETPDLRSTDLDSEYPQPAPSGFSTGPTSPGTCRKLGVKLGDKRTLVLKAFLVPLSVPLRAYLSTAAGPSGLGLAKRRALSEFYLGPGLPAQAAAAPSAEARARRERRRATALTTSP